MAMHVNNLCSHNSRTETFVVLLLGLAGRIDLQDSPIAEDEQKEKSG